MTQMPNFFGMESTEKSSYSKPPALCTRGSTTEESESAAKAKSDVTGDPWKKTGNRQVPDMFAPPVFDGVHPDPETWLAHFRRYVDCRLMPEDDQLAFFPLFLKSAAIDWYDGLSAIQKRSTELLLKEFEQYFCPSPMDQVLNTESVFNRNQKPGEKVRDYVAAMQKLARRIPAVDEDLLKCMVLRGLQPQIKAFVLQHASDIHTVGDISTLAKVAEAAGIETTGANGDMATVMEEIRQSRAEVRMLTNRLDRMSLNTVSSRSPTPERRRVRFQTSTYAGRGTLRRGTPRGTPATTTNRGSCERCGRGHYGLCPATNMNCYNLQLWS